ncbi:MAG: MarR family winged helix-turn-helix transcriptional regulator [Acidimicrobiales bacterium]
METAPTTTDTAARLRRAITRLNRRLRASGLGGLTAAQASMLSSVESLGSPSLGELAAAEQVQPPSVTHAVRDLETAGMIVSARDPSDRRCTRVRLTALGRRELMAVRARKTQFLNQRLATLSPAELRRAEEATAFLERLLEDE